MLRSVYTIRSLVSSEKGNESMPGLVLPIGHKRDLTGLFVGAAVVVMGVPGHADHVALVTRVHDEDHRTTDASGKPQVWTGKRPMLDLIFVGNVEDDPADWEIFQVENIAHHDDVAARLLLEGKSPRMIAVCPRYAVLQEMGGY